MKPIDLRKILQGKAGMWVSIAPNHKKIVAEAKTFKELLEKLQKMGDPQGYITNVGKDYSRFIG